MYNILMLNRISELGLKNFATGYNCSDSCSDPHGILVRSALIKNPEKYKNLLAIARAGAGTNNINIKACNKLGIAVFNTPGANANAVKELIISGLILASRNIISGVNWVNSHYDEKDISELVEKEKKQFKGNEIKGKKLGVIGLGSIGTLVANTACSLNMKVFGYDPFISVKSAWNLCRLVKKIDSIESIFSECDYITLHVPLNNTTENMINKKLLSIVKPEVKILNFSRPEIVNNKDIIKFIQAKKVSKYITDFPQREFKNIENIISIPHLGASTIESENNCAAMASEELIDYLENGNTKNSVNFPTVNLPKSTKTRLCIFSKNIPNVMSKVLDIISSKNINIENMQGHSKNDFSYTIIDTNSSIDKSLINIIKNSLGIINIRVIY